MLKLLISLFAVFAVIILAGCAGSNAQVNQNPYAGSYYGSIAFATSRGGGPDVVFNILTVSPNGTASGDVDYKDQKSVPVNGSISPDGVLVVNIPNYWGTVQAAGQLVQTSTQPGRGGYNGPFLAGTVQVTEVSDGQTHHWDNSSVELFPAQ